MPRKPPLRPPSPRHKERPRGRSFFKRHSRSTNSRRRSAPSPRRLGKGLEIHLGPDIFAVPEYYTPLPQPFSVHFGRHEGHWWVYRTFDRVDNFFRSQQFRIKQHFLTLVPKSVVETRDVVRINDFLSTASVLRADEERKTEMKGAFGRGFRPTARSMRGRRVLNSYLAAYAREQQKTPPTLLPHVFRAAAEIVAYQVSIGRSLDARAQEAPDGLLSELKASDRPPSPTTPSLQEFVKTQAAAVHTRLSASGSPVDVQRRLRALLPTKRAAALNAIPLRGITAGDMLSELLELPTWFSVHFHVLRVCSETPLVLISEFPPACLNDTNKMAVREASGSTRLLRVRPSRFRHGVQPTQLLATADLRKGASVSARLLEPPRRPPSIASESGFSTVSMSTATTSPNSWQQKWTMQMTHDEYEHRLAESSIPNQRAAFVSGQEQYAQRRNIETNARIDECIADMKRLREQMNINARLDAVIGAACDVRLPKVPPPDPGDLQWLEKAEHRLRTLLGRQQSELSAEDARDLQMLTYAKERYETRLAAFDDAESGPQTPKDGWAARGLALNDAWMNTLQGGRLDAATVDALRCVISDGDAWLPDCGCSNVQLVERSDHQSARNGVQTDLFGRFSMDDGQARTLTFIAIFFYMAVQVSFWIVMMSAPTYDREFKTCPQTDTTPGKPAGPADASRLLNLFGVPPIQQ